MAIAPQGLGLQINSVWMGSRDASGVTLEPWVAAVVIHSLLPGPDSLVYPLNYDQAIIMRDRLRLLSEPKAKPKTAGERYKASKEKIGLRFQFDYDNDGIFLADRNASPEGIGADDVGSISFKSGKMFGVNCVPLSAEECASFAKTLTEVLERHEEPPP
jgi:hypothetical protein